MQKHRLTERFPEPTTPVPEPKLRPYTEKEKGFLAEDIIATIGDVDTYHRTRLDRMVARQHIDTRRLIEGIVRYPEMEPHYRKQIAIGRCAVARFCEYFDERYGVQPSEGLDIAWGPNPTERLVISVEADARQAGIEILRADFDAQAARELAA